MKKRKYKYHTDEFLRKRQNDPDWREYYLRRKKQRRKEFVFGLIFTVVLIIGLFVFYQYKLKGTEYDFISDMKTQIDKPVDTPEEKINQKAMTIEQVDIWVNEVLEYRKNNLDDWSFLKEEAYGNSITTANQSDDGLVYIEVRQNSPDGTHDNYITTFRINAEGYLEEYNELTDMYEVVAKEYGDTGIMLN